MTEQAELNALAEYAGRGRSRLCAFLRDVGEEEWEWSPEEGTPSARETVAGLLLEEEALRGRFVDDARAARTSGRPRGATPETAADAVRRLAAVRAATLAAVRAAPPERYEDAARLLASLAFADGAVFGHVALLLRLMDPLRASPAIF
jgi:uncharacterized damage-inducible protein DinB